MDITVQASVVQRLDSAIHWINHYPLDISAIKNLLSYGVTVFSDVINEGVFQPKQKKPFA